MRRSFLFTPANDARRIAHLHERGADAVILDLEDAVALSDKEIARAGLGVIAHELVGRGVDVFIRINAPWLMAVEDLKAAVSAGVHGVVAAKVSDPGQARVVGEMIRELEVERQLTAGTTELIALIESAEGLQRAAEIASVSHVSGLALGSEDLSVQLGVAPSADSLELPCKLIALAAAPRGLMALGAPVSIAEFRDLEAYAAAMDCARRVGMTGVFCIHPAQVEVANVRFAPSEAELSEARGVLEAWAQAERESRSVIAYKGRMIDAPVVARARRLVER
jgi:citrate lyase subunit beta/citryl-CoA lyase